MCGFLIVLVDCLFLPSAFPVCCVGSLFFFFFFFFLSSAFPECWFLVVLTVFYRLHFLCVVLVRCLFLLSAFSVCGLQVVLIYCLGGCGVWVGVDVINESCQAVFRWHPAGTHEL